MSSTRYTVSEVKNIFDKLAENAKELKDTHKEDIFERPIRQPKNYAEDRKKIIYIIEGYELNKADYKKKSLLLAQELMEAIRLDPTQTTLDTIKDKVGQWKKTLEVYKEGARVDVPEMREYITHLVDMLDEMQKLIEKAQKEIDAVKETKISEEKEIEEKEHNMSVATTLDSIQRDCTAAYNKLLNILKRHSSKMSDEEARYILEGRVDAEVKNVADKYKITDTDLKDYRACCNTITVLSKATRAGVEKLMQTMESIPKAMVTPRNSFSQFIKDLVVKIAKKINHPEIVDKLYPKDALVNVRQTLFTQATEKGNSLLKPDPARQRLKR